VRPAWLTPRTALTAALAAVGSVASGLELSGVWKAAPIAVLALLAVASVVQEHQEKSRAEDAESARSRLDVQVNLVPGVVQRSADVMAFVERWTAEEREECLASVEANSKPAARPMLDLDTLEPPDGEGASLTLDEMEDLEARIAAGENLSDDEQRRYNAAKRAMKLAGFTAALAARKSTAGFLNAFSLPEDRTPDQYRQEVERHLTDIGEMLSAISRWHEIDQGLAAVQVEIANRTERNYMSVEVEIYLPDDVKGINPDEVPELPDAPARPRAFGTGKPTGLGLGLFPLMLPTYAPARVRYGPIIDNSGSVRVTHRPIDLRPGEAVRLDVIHLITTAPAGTVLTGTWVATATNADGRATGDLSVTIRDSTLYVDAVLSGWLAGDGDHGDE